jgi:hypothetical protein
LLQTNTNTTIQTWAGSHSCAPPLCSSDPGREKSIRACAPSAQHGRHRSLLHLLGEKAPFPRGELQSSGRVWRRATTTGELPHETPRKLLHGCTSQERQRAASPSEFPHWAPAGRAPTRLPGGGAEPQPATHRPRVCFLLLAFFGRGDTTCAEWGIGWEIAIVIICYAKN